MEEKTQQRGMQLERMLECRCGVEALMEKRKEDVYIAEQIEDTC